MRGPLLLTLLTVCCASAALAAEEIVVASYNLENYLGAFFTSLVQRPSRRDRVADEP